MMKLTIVFMFIACMQVQAEGYGQSVSLSVQNVPLKNVLKIIKKQSGYHLVYREEWVELSGKVTLDLKDVTLKDALDACFENQNITYELVGKTIVVKKAAASLEQYVDKKYPEEARDIVIRGRVTNETGNPLEGVSIVVKGTKRGTTTDADGRFQMSVVSVSNAELVFSFVGYRSKTVKMENQTEFNIVINQVISDLTDVVVVGYGTQSRKDLTGSISRVSSKDFKDAVVSTIDQALQGKASGVQVVQSSGEPGGNVVVRIRGINSLSGDNQPLYVIDGFPMPPYTEANSSSKGTYGANGLYGLNPNDIENIEILKDAAATSIYGSRGANGVILITTKQGKAGDPKIEIVSKSSLSSMGRPIEMMSDFEFAEVKNQSMLNAMTSPADTVGIRFLNVDSIRDNHNPTSWLDLITRKAFRQETSINILGGAGKTNYFVSGTYLLENGVLKGSDNKRGSIRLNLNTSVKNWYDTKIQLAATRAKMNRAITTSGGWPYGGGPLFDALRSAPLHRNEVNHEDGFMDEFGGISFSTIRFFNPLQELLEKTHNTYNDQVIGNIDNTFYLNPGRNLQLHAVLGSSLNGSKAEINIPYWLSAGRDAHGTLLQANVRGQSFNSSWYLSHKKEIGNHRFNSTGGVEYTNTVVDVGSMSGTGVEFPSIALYNMQSAKNQSVTSYKEESVIQSGFLRENYSFNDKYLLSVSFRADGSSKFAENRKWGLFPSAALAWNLAEEGFMRRMQNIDEAKLRVSYGLTGSQSLPAYRSLRRYSPSFYELGNTPGGANTSMGLFVASPNNPDLKWETTEQTNVGFDFSYLDGRLSFNFDWYNKMTRDLLQELPIPAQSGYALIWANMGSIRNRGIDLRVGIQPVVLANFNWETSIVFSKNKTLVVDLGEFDPTSRGITSSGGNLFGGGSTILIPGRELGLFYGYHVIGLYQKDDFDNTGTLIVPKPDNVLDNKEGRYKYEDLNKDGKINMEDRMVLGSSQPKFILGWNNNLRYKSWSLSLSFNGSFGNKILNMGSGYFRTGVLNLSGMSFNQTKDWYLNKYTPENPHNDPRYPAVQAVPNGGALAFWDAHSTMVEDGSYIRLKNLTLLYSFINSKQKWAKNLSAYFTGTNLLTFTKYSGFDPEVSSYGGNVKLSGIDYGAYPNFIGYTLGINLTL